MKGLHIIADLYNCASHELLISASSLGALCLSASQAAGLKVLGEQFYQFDGFDQVQDGGVTGTVVLAESHLAIHTWPEHASATLDVYVCNVSGDNSHMAEALYARLLAALKPAEVIVERLWRGKDVALVPTLASISAAA
jgi:S-adenosylmethionine decarboxylase